MPIEFPSRCGRIYALGLYGGRECVLLGKSRFEDPAMKHLSQLVVGLVVLGLLARSGFGGAAAEQQPELKTAKAVPVKYYLALPAGWNAKKTWPILVTISGSGHNFLPNCQEFMQARSRLPFIIVTPHVISNGNDPNDLAAVLAIVREVQKDAQGQPKFFITGFSAGGHLAWQLILMHPELLAAAAPAAGNFLGRGVTEVSSAKERVQLPIHGFQGDKDQVLDPLNKQWTDAEDTARKHGYTNIVRTVVPGAGHQAFPQQVVSFFAGLIAAPAPPAAPPASATKE